MEVHLWFIIKKSTTEVSIVQTVSDQLVNSVIMEQKSSFVYPPAGDTLLAEASFEQEVEVSRRLRLAAEQLAASEGRREADAARNVASLAVVRGDLTKAVRYFQMSALQRTHQALQRAADHIYKREGFSDAYRDAARARDDSRDALIIATRK